MRLHKTLMIPLFAGALLAQGQTRTETTTTSTTWLGTLVDANCQTTRTERQQTNQLGDRTVTTTQETSCPVTPTTNTYGLMTADGRFIRFDNSSNARVSDELRRSQLLLSQPMRVRVVGTTNGELAVVQTVSPADTVVVGGAERVAIEEIVAFDAQHKGDHGKLVADARSVRFENVSDATKGHVWAYSQIKEFKRDGANKVELKPFSGDSWEFSIDGVGMSDVVYKTISDRIVAARVR